MRILDRYIIKSFLVNYLLALAVMVGMYVLLDLIVNVQDFAKGVVYGGPDQGGNSAWDIASDMLNYYFFQLPVIFQQVSGAVPTLAAGFTMMRMTRHHELTAMLASGVSLYRVAAPIILISTLLAAVHVTNQELVISQPYMIQKVMRKHDEVRQATNRNEPLYFIKDTDGSLLSARDYDPAAKTMENVSIIYRDDSGRSIRHKVAQSAAWKIPAGENTEAWVLSNVVEQDDTGKNVASRVAIHAPTEIDRTSLTPEQLNLVLSNKAVDYLSSEKVWELARVSPEVNRPLLFKIMHLRFTQPLMNIVMLLIGIPFLLTREPNRLVWNMAFCTAVSAVVFVSTFVIFQMGGTQVDPLLAAWLPVLIFGPFALVMREFIKT